MSVVAAPKARGFSINRKTARWLYGATILLIALAMALAAVITSQQMAAEAAAAGEVSDFEISDVFQTWSWILLAGTFVITSIYSIVQRSAFATTVQVTLIALLLVCFLFIAQQVDRDFYRVGTTALIFFTLLQVAFGNISPEANFRQSVQGVVLTAIILGFVIWLSITLVPYLIQLGR
jgi:hypothetical protein